MPTRDLPRRVRTALLGVLTASALLTIGAALAPPASVASCPTCEDPPPPPDTPHPHPAPPVEHRVDTAAAPRWDDPATRPSW